MKQLTNRKHMLGNVFIATLMLTTSYGLSQRFIDSPKKPVAVEKETTKSFDEVIKISPIELQTLKSQNVFSEATTTEAETTTMPETTTEAETTTMPETTTEVETTAKVVETTTQEPQTEPETETEPVVTQAYSDYELISLAKVIFSEAGCAYCSRHAQQAYDAGITPDIWQQYVGYVFMNRISSSKFPNTIEGVLRGGYDSYTIQRFEAGIYSEESLRNAAIVLENYYNGTIPVPSTMVFQAEFPQGSTYLKVGRTYFGLME